MIHRNGDLFTTDVQIIAHGANIKGVMGAGIAKTIKEKFPENFERYEKWCNNQFAVPGEWLAYHNRIWPYEDVLLLNLFTQDNPGANAKYEWVAQSLLNFSQFYIEKTKWTFGTRIAIPEIGSGIGGLEYKNVEKILHLVEDIYPIEFEVWHYV